MKERGHRSEVLLDKGDMREFSSGCVRARVCVHMRKYAHGPFFHVIQSLKFKVCSSIK